MSTLRMELTLEVGQRRSNGRWVAIASCGAQKYVSLDFDTEAAADAEGRRMLELIRAELPRDLAQHGFDVSITVKGRSDA